VDYYNISLHGFFFYDFFSNWSLSIFFLYWASWEFSFVVFSKITLWIVTVFSPHGFCFAAVFSHMFFLKLSLSNLFFQYLAGWELSFNFPHNFFPFILFYSKIVLFFFCFFFRIVFVDFIFFYYWAGWEFSFLVFFFETLWVATVFPRMVFFRIIFVDFFFSYWADWYFNFVVL